MSLLGDVYCWICVFCCCFMLIRRGKLKEEMMLYLFLPSMVGGENPSSLAQIQVSVALNPKCLLFTKELIKLWSLKTNLTSQVLAPTAVLHYLIYDTLNQSVACFTQPGRDIWSQTSWGHANILNWKDIHCLAKPQQVIVLSHHGSMNSQPKCISSATPGHKELSTA